ncbi:putative sporulation protein YtxC [Salirhabdus euzebyi]|uniref:Putative sporulation protein YtxC n=1 Tax=Salirhabdus euzebyi TaxID=394506 RepID=A0A841PSW4_9BACI|nr:sporulation protein YtxC [Salirhabdus euzebyi]MBB6452067.1 putative sporulation protein YtxC [Salirhabdus euzebyi]
MIRQVFVFHQKDQAEAFYHKIFHREKVKRIRIQLEEGNTYFIRVEIQQEHLQFYWKRVVLGLIHVFILFQLPELAKSILKKDYYFSNKHEIAHIIPILQSIMQNPKKYGSQSEIKSAFQFYYLFVNEVKLNKQITFIELVEKCEKEYKDYLIDVTGYAIDEWKREEEYQEFIHDLRTYLKEKRPRIPTLLITYDGDFQFFKPDGRRYTIQELKTLQYEETLHFIELLSSDFPLSSLITIAPKEIFIYTNNPSDPKMILLQNVYQENATIRSLRKFPFIGKKA